MENAIISYLGENKPNLITDITTLLTELGGQFSGVTFATLGRGCELTMVYKTPENSKVAEIKKSLENLETCKDGEFTVKLFQLSTEAGPTTKITHRIILSGEDQPGLLHKIIKTLDQNSAVIVRMNTEKITYPENTQYISRFAIAVREDNAPQCLSEIVKVAGQMKLTFRYETS
jgi:glycine cleavage system transcriptional repressor